MMKGKTENYEVSTMVTRRSNQNWSSKKRLDQTRTNYPKPTDGADKSTYKCTQCNQSGHIKNRCFEIVGYPDWWDHNRDPRKRNSKKTPNAAFVETNT
ncbi:putative transcription factor interactor and regulator CCHC(Zn) family [Lupinus albus]|uniref:Putative transcription factor interactor and regulator CCHC(Zn) family n=1 Tax=Lupinus albus TaxID=3870 RepID=A0A6A4N8D8_LUPAL|nr:putative transcription factor interactor and regulator CCHC(Zn) family [Lupinus albus]